MKLLNFLVYRAPHADKLAGPCLLVGMTALFWGVGVLFADTELEGFSNPAELLGQTLLLILTPALLVSYLIVGERRSVRRIEAMVAAGLVPASAAAAGERVPASHSLLGAACGFAYGVALNVRFQWVLDFANIGVQLQSIVFGQLLVWTLTGLLLVTRLHAAWRLHQLGKIVPIDLYDVRRFEPFARHGLDDVFAIAVLLVLSTVQSLDAQLRWDNYTNALLVAVPAAAVLLLLPMGSLHRRLRARKQEMADALWTRIAAASPAANEAAAAPALAELELLMQHHDRVRRTSTWPIDFSVASQLVLYLFIPPLAWVGAALVELGIDRYLSEP